MTFPCITVMMLVLIQGSLGTLMNHHLLPKSSEPGGVCMDGTQAGYYYAPPASGSSSLWVLFLQGGGACYTEDDCVERSKTGLGSSKFQKPTLEFSKTFLNDNATENPDFYDSHKVHVPYCTSDTHAGQSTVANASTWGFYFCGHLNFQQIVAHINQTILEFSQATHIMLTGSSAGGAGTIHNLDWFRSVIPPSTVVKGVPHAGFFFPGYTADQNAAPSDVFLPPSTWAQWSTGKSGGLDLSKAAVLWEASPNLDCQNHWAPQGKSALCASAMGLYPFIKNPLFILENQFDTNQLSAQLGMPKTPKDLKDPQVQKFIAYFGQSMAASIQEPHMKKGDGFFLPSCYDHGDGLGAGTASDTTTIPGAPTQTELVGDWFFERGKISNYFVADNCQMEPPGLPCNPTCDGALPRPPNPDNCSAQLKTDGCIKKDVKTDPKFCEQCAQSHRVDLAKAGCTLKEVKGLCGLQV